MSVLYKYIPGERVRSCIPEVGDGTLRATQPIALNDPFECAVHPLYAIPDRSEENELLAEALTAINEDKPVTPSDVEQARQQHGSLFTRQLLVQQFSTRFGLVSLASNPHSLLMWSHYTADGSGFVIGYDAVNLHLLANDLGWLREVIYLDHPPPIAGPSVVHEPTSNVPILLSVKSDDWAYEQEWRLIADLSKTIGTGETDRRGAPINLVRVPNEAIVSVHYTERTSAELVDLVKKRLADPNNRFGADAPTKLVVSTGGYGYQEALIEQES